MLYVIDHLDEACNTFTEKLEKKFQDCQNANLLLKSWRDSSKDISERMDLQLVYLG
jgi:hypothetical protein